MADENPIRIGVIGLGRTGWQNHCRQLATLPAMYRIAAAADPDPARQDEAQRTFGCRSYPTPQALLADREVELVTIATPSHLHLAHVEAALAAGKHVVCEKPMALTKADCEAVLYKALQVHRMVFGVMQNRYSPPSQWIKSVVDQGLLGDIYLVQVNCYWNRDARYYKPGGWKGTTDLDGGTLFTQFSHFVDIMYWLFGDITDIHGQFADFNHQELTEFEDSGLVTFRFRNGGMGCLNYSTAVWDRNLESSMTIIGSKGSVKIGGQYMDQVEYCHIRDYTMPELPPTNPANDYGAYKGSANNHGFVVDNVVATLRGSSTLTTNALEGMKVVEIIERIYQKRDERSV